MIARLTNPLAELYDADETAWLEAMSAHIRGGRLAELDLPHLAEYLDDMARRDRREVKSRLVSLIAHILKWTRQPDQRSGSWRRTIIAQRQELGDLLESGTLRNHAEAILAEAYTAAVEQAAAETDLPAPSFPAECPWTLELLLAPEVPGQ
jgi:hypothetical protein